MTVVGYVIGVVLSYLIGSITWGYLFGRLGGIDIRRWGSGNVGATNVARVLGAQRGIVVLVLDTLKGVAAAGLVGRMLGGAWNTDPTLFLVFCSVAVILGHIFPCWLKFRGGKGVAAALGAWLVLQPVPTLIALAVWIVLVAVWRYVSLGSITAAATLPFAVWLWNRSDVKAVLPQLIFAVVLSVLVIVRHLGNIRRLIRGTENRIGQSTAKDLRAKKPEASS
ncbi:MAG TPA: glycerol-3-phosphate 1-O-acyltransferase PlsY [Planctomycetota bacterium]|nr:glycerol-3-phosphate 1-O-acyltransferase PlsY [Planctomycetota bacterium]